MRTNKGLVEYAEKMTTSKTVYMWGSFGQLVTDSFINQKAKQYPSWYTPARVKKFKSLVGKDVYAFDCVGLIKGYMWDGGYIPSQDKSANGMYRAAKVKGNISTLPEKAGVLVWMSGHIGVYIGNSEVIECSPKWKNGVQKTKLNDRKWKMWCECPYIEYIKEEGDLAYYISNIQEKIGLEDKTIQYLTDYKYGEELIKKISKGLR